MFVCAPRAVWVLCGDQKIKLLRCCCTGHPGSRVKSFAVSGNGKVAVTVLFDSSISVWDLEEKKVGHWASSDLCCSSLRCSSFL